MAEVGLAVGFIHPVIQQDLVDMSVKGLKASASKLHTYLSIYLICVKNKKQYKESSIKCFFSLVVYT